jgi:hypothetical protein
LREKLESTGIAAAPTLAQRASSALVPVDRAAPFVPFDELVRELGGLMLPHDRLDDELHELDETPRDLFA